MSNSASRVVHPAEARVRAPRVSLDGNIVVESKTLGTNVSYRLTTDNVSKSGLLLHWSNDSRLPFIINTLIEMTIDPGATILKQPVNCLGKIVRKEGAVPTQFGVRIVQIDNSDLEVWEACVSLLERDARHLVTEDPAEHDEQADSLKKRHELVSVPAKH